VNSVLSVPYYFGILRNMVFEEPATEPPGPGDADDGAVRFSVYLLAAATVGFAVLIVPLTALVGASGLL
jgi:NADH:ubiquinone oxidoreductase subunit 2 (subunit N)